MVYRVGQKKMAQFIISHYLSSGLCSNMKLHTSKLQHVCSQYIRFQLNLTKKYENAKGFKKGCLKIQYCTLINCK